MIHGDEALPVVQQCQLLGISRSSFYYEPVPISEADLGLMRRIDELHLDYPFLGSRQIKRLLVNEGVQAGRKPVATLMRRMGIEALYCKKHTSRWHPEHAVFPYLLRGLTINRANQVWAMDITYLPMARGFVYLAAVLDWHSRRVLSWRLSNTLTADFCVEAVVEAIARHGTPEIFNTDQGSQFTSLEFIEPLRERGIRISMGRQGLLARQHLRRATLAHGEVRGGLPARVRIGFGGAGCADSLLRVLQQSASAFFA